MSDNHIIDEALNYLADYINQANQLIKTQLKTGTAASVAAGARYTYYFTINDEPGYTPLGIIHVNMTGDAASLASLVSYGMTSDLRGWVTIFNDSTAAHTWNSQVIVLYKGQKMVQANPVEYVNDYTMMMNRQLEMSVNPWSSGTCSITGISNYDVIKVIQNGQQPLIGLRRQGTSATQAFYYLFSVIPTSASQYTKGGIITTNGDSCTFNRNIVALNHAPSSNHGALGGAESIIKVVGLIPRHDTIADIQTPLSNPMTDFIISQGDTGWWIWRKWNSGIAECWRFAKETTATAFTAAGNVFYKTANFNLPVDFFTEPPTINVTVGCGNVTAASVTDVTTTTFKVPIMSASATARAVEFHMHAIGKWK